ncbi:hypothetical protein [Brevundimonas sp.]|uniref:hypothetical protein n=1 Tax=Brevundimonas sp. TaxID=1871086 RepID=UPI001A192AA6|nr:hypothetical protein [Brevundimonas sp.]MBJ7483189.1 hypothetical protein [Brevundimonas sp.]
MSKADIPRNDQQPSVTLDGRYLIRGGLWRRADPALTPDQRGARVHELLAARRAVRDALGYPDADALAAARGRVDAAKTPLGERGPVWWSDGAPDLNRNMARTTHYAAWFEAVEDRRANWARARASS